MDQRHDPGSYIAVLSVTLLVLFGVLFGLQFLKNKVYIVGIVFSILISIALDSEATICSAPAGCSSR